MAPEGPLAQVEAPAAWKLIDFLSDVHLHPEDPATAQRLGDYLAPERPDLPDALFVLGDLFEVWVGDDLLDAPPPLGNPFWAECLDLFAVFARQRPVFFVAGNRDFLLGPQACARGGMRRLDDPTVLVAQGRRWLLSHGDALCLADVNYQRFRAEVRSPWWQLAFLARPLSERLSLARALRSESEARRTSPSADRMLDLGDLDTSACRAWLQATLATTLVHGHTHRPATHDLGEGLNRVVLADWDMLAPSPRAEVLRMKQGCLHRIDLAKPHALNF